MSLVKDVIQRTLGKAGYRLQRFDPAQVIPEEIADKDLYVGPEDQNRLFRPWLSEEYSRLFTPEVVANTMLSRQKLYFLFKILRGTLALPGDVFEAGSGSGGSARLILNCLRQEGAKKRMWLLDTFEGYQKVDRELDGAHVQVNQCKCNGVEDVRRLLKDGQIEAHVIKGLIPGTLCEVKTNQISFAHIDVNLHEPTLAATEFCLDRMEAGAVIVFDDYSWPATYGARLAIDKACERRKQEVICVPESTQAFLIKT